MTDDSKLKYTEVLCGIAALAEEISRLHILELVLKAVQEGEDYRPILKLLGLGGYRPGAGQKPRWNAGPTTVVRIPEAMVKDVLWYARLIDEQLPNGLQVSDCLSCLLHSNSVTQSKELADQLKVITKERDCLDKECSELADNVGILHLQVEEMKQQYDSVTQSSNHQALSQAIEILEAALSFKANAGRAIKEQIRRALVLLEAA